MGSWMSRLPHFLSYKARAWSFAIKGWFRRHQICRQDFVKVNLSNTKNPPCFFYFGLLFRPRNATYKLPRVNYIAVS